LSDAPEAGEGAGFEVLDVFEDLADREDPEVLRIGSDDARRANRNRTIAAPLAHVVSGGR
jgi:hypothetical protein